MATLADRLAKHKWLFHEKGIMHVWNELKAFANSAGEGGVTTTGAGYGASDYVTHCDPDVTERLKDSGHERSESHITGVAMTSPPTQSV